MALLVDTQRKSWNFFPKGYTFPKGMYLTLVHRQRFYLMSEEEMLAGRGRFAFTSHPLHMVSHDFTLLFPNFSVPVSKFRLLLHLILLQFPSLKMLLSF